MQTVYRWQCPKCGKKYVNGQEPTFCEEQLSLHAPAHPRADAATGLFATRCGAPILPLDAPEPARDGHDLSDSVDACGPTADGLPGGPIMAILLNTVNARGLHYARSEQFPLLEFTLNCDHSVIQVLVSARETQQQLIVYAVLGPKAPPERRAAVAEYIARVNHKCYIGAFDLNFEDGSVRFRAGIDVEGGVLTEAMVDNLLVNTTYVADGHHELLMKVIYGGMEPKAVLEGEAN